MRIADVLGFACCSRKFALFDRFVQQSLSEVKSLKAKMNQIRGVVNPNVKIASRENIMQLNETIQHTDSRYETGKIKPPFALVKLLKLLEMLDEVRAQ